MKTDRTILNVLFAAMAGFAIGMLFAPERGSRTRRKIKEKGEDYLENIRDEYDHSLDRLKHKVDVVYDKLNS